MSGAVTAVVVAGRGGETLRGALASVAWADERVVLDPAGRLPADATPAGVGRATTLEGCGTAPWVLLLGEDERAPVALAAAVRAAAAGPAAAWRIGRELHLLGMRLRPRRAPLRLAPRGARLVLTRSLELALRAAPGLGRPRRLDPVLAVERAASLDDVMATLAADAGMLAALLAWGGARARPGSMGLAAAAAAGSVLAAVSDARLGVGRWVAAVLQGYRAVVAWTTLWERARGSVDVR